MAITKSSAKSESWTVRIPNDLAKLVRERFPANTGNTDIVLESLKALVGIDSNLSNSASNSCLQNELEEIRTRLSALEDKIKSKGLTVEYNPPAATAVSSDWINLGMIAHELRVKPKSIADAVSKRGQDIGNDTIQFEMSNKIIHKKGKGLNALYKIQ